MRPFVALLPFFTVAALAQPVPEDSVRVAFAAYREAVAARDGAGVWARVDARTRAYYDALVEAARHAPEEEVRRLPFTEQLAVLSVRLRVDPDTLAELDGRGLFARAVREGWVGRDLGRARLDAVAVRGAEARAWALRGPSTEPAELVFRREDGTWRLDLVALTESAARPFGLLMRQAGLSPTDLALRLLAGETGAPVPPTVWIPPHPR